MSTFSPSGVRVPQGGSSTGGFVYNNPNGSRFVQNADGSKFYDPGPNGVGRKWYESADGVRTYITDAQSTPSPAKKVKMEEQEGKMAWANAGAHPSLMSPNSTPSKPRNKVKKEYESDDTMPLYPDADVVKTPKTKAAPKKSNPTTKPAAQAKPKASAPNPNTPAKARATKSKPSETPNKSPKIQSKGTPKTTKSAPATSSKSPAKGTPKPSKSPTKQTKSKSNEVHIHIHPPAPKPAMNVTRVIHHSTKGDKEIVYKSPVKGKISKGQKKVVHIHHHKGD